MESPPTTLFKYQGFSVRLFSRICNGEAHFADPSSFNDPLDCRPTVETDLEADALKAILANLVSRRVEKEVVASLKKLRFRPETIVARQESEAQRVIQTLLQNIEYEADHPDISDANSQLKCALGNAIEFEIRRAYDQGVLCLSARCDSPLMWSHYGDQHKGVCIEYDVSKLRPQEIRKVEYGESRQLKASAIQRWLENTGDVIARQQIERACLLTKSTEWNYEGEYRIFGRQGDHGSPAPIKSVTFGLRCDIVVKYAVVAALGGEKSPYGIYEMNSLGAKFELSRREVDVDELMRGMPNTTGLWDFDIIEGSGAG